MVGHPRYILGSSIRRNCAETRLDSVPLVGGDVAGIPRLRDVMGVYLLALAGERDAGGGSACNTFPRVPFYQVCVVYLRVVRLANDSLPVWVFGFGHL